MSLNWATWQVATRCDPPARQGTKALMAWVLETYPDAANWGIYVCREVAGRSNYSCHAEGRATDIGLPYVNGGANPVGHKIVKRIGEHGKRLGIQAAIFDRRIWSEQSPTGRYYSGSHPHYDHIHFEMTRKAADTLTLSTFRQILGTSGPAPTPPPADSYDKVVDSLPMIDLSGVSSRVPSTWPRGATIKTLQGALIARSFAPANTIRDDKVDGIAGPGTKSAVRRFQEAKGLKADYKVGDRTWDKLFGTLKLLDLSDVTSSSSTWVRGGLVKTLQGMLVARGFAPRNTIQGDEVDGIAGPGTKAALGKFQGATGLKKDFMVGSRTWSKLV